MPALISTTLWLQDDQMPLVIDCVLVDCVDLGAMTLFWCQVLDLEHMWTGPSDICLSPRTDPGAAWG